MNSSEVNGSGKKSHVINVPIHRFRYRLLALFGVLSAVGCQQAFIDDADREVAHLVETRQLAALGFSSDAAVGSESGDIGPRADMYRFVPSPVDSRIPEEFERATQPGNEVEQDGGAAVTTPSNPPDADVQEAAGADEGADKPDHADMSADNVGVDGQPTEEPQSQSDSQPDVQPFTLTDAFAYALAHARDFQFEKESLYFAALDLTLERHLWTPRFVNSLLSLEYANYGQVRDFDRAMSAVSNFAVEQRLPYGGEVTARVVNSLMRDIVANTTSGESGQFVLETRLPLLRGAGRVAYESRYQAERNLVYAVRRFERFRREFLVRIAGDYFDLLSTKSQIESAKLQAESLKSDYDRAQARAETGRILQIEADRARVGLLNARNGVVNAREQYETELDAFKILLGMPTRQAIDVVEEDVQLADPKVDSSLAIDTAIKYRLDLINTRDAIDDARRQVEIARNSLLPQLDFNGSMTMVTDPNKPNSADYNTERTTWRAGLDLEVPLDRKQERNDYRASLIGLRRTQRDYDESADQVRLEVRRAVRRLEQARFTMGIQTEQIRINEFRRAQARAQLEVGRLTSNRDVIEAEADLRSARDDYANAVSQYRRAVLEFLRDTGTLRVGNDGRWLASGETSGAKTEEGGGDAGS